MADTKLKPCPFCGGEAELIFDDWCGTHIASCKKRRCFAFRWKDDATYDSAAEAIEAWNRRVNDGNKENL